MNVTKQKLQKKLSVACNPQYLDIIDESANHNVPEGAESHFKVVAVSEQFSGKRAVQRHQQVYALLKDELENGIHALALHLYTPQEWQEKSSAPPSPVCLGGDKR